MLVIGSITTVLGAYSFIHDSAAHRMPLSLICSTAMITFGCANRLWRYAVLDYLTWLAFAMTVLFFFYPRF